MVGFRFPEVLMLTYLKSPKIHLELFEKFKMASKMAAAILSYLRNCVKQSIFAQFYFVLYHFNWFYGQ